MQFFNRAYLVLVIWVKIHTSLLSGLPLIRDGTVDVCLMNNLWDQLWAFIDEVGAWSWNLSSRNRVCCAIFKKETDQSLEGVQKETQNEQVDDQKEGGTAAHYDAEFLSFEIVVVRRG